MNDHALKVLELERVLALVAERAGSELGRAAVRARRPGTDPDGLRRELARVTEVRAFVDASPDWGPPPVPDARPALRRLSVEGGVVEPMELHTVGVLLRSSRTLAEALDRRAPDPDEESASPDPLASLRALLHADRDAEEAVERTVDAEGEVLDGASRELGRIRSELRRAHSRIVQKLERYMGSLPDRYRVADASVSIREGRYVIPVRREGKSEVGGVIHDESATGATLFVEPPLALGLMNELKELEREEQREIHRILRALSDRLRPDRDALVGAQDALVDFDSLHARARTARQWDGEAPELLEPGSGRVRIVRGRHPLLVAGDEEVVPFDLDLEEGERVLVVSGPNTGGKSVFLKSVGLIAALAQSGCVPPVGAGTVLPVFTDLFADIGDEQSIAESLSTFSAHLENLKELVEGADGDSLVLIDEMGTGTDPTEGAALARAILEALEARGSLAVVTSHLGALKTMADDDNAIVNASLQFDPDRMEPTYRFVKGRPGRSYGLAIARRLGFPSGILDRAETHVSEGEAALEDVLEKLERKEKEAEALVERLTREKEEAERRRKEAEALAEELRERERTHERRAREEARELLMKAREEVEEAIEEVRGAADREALDEAARAARRRVEEAARRQREKKPAPLPGDAPDLEPGMRVRLAEGGRTGVVKAVDDDRVTVELGGLRMEVAPEKLRAIEAGGPGDAGRATGSDGGTSRRRERTERRAAARENGGGSEGGGYTATLETDPSYELDLRGLRVDEVEMELGRGLDAAVLADLHEVRIIHGKGTGAVRSRVQELLKRDKRVTDFRLGQRGEGGTGVTVAKLA